MFTSKPQQPLKSFHGIGEIKLFPLQLQPALGFFPPHFLTGVNGVVRGLMTSDVCSRLNEGTEFENYPASHDQTSPRHRVV